MIVSSSSLLHWAVGSTWKDTFEHFTELILLGIPEITELVASTVAGAFLARLGCLLSPTLDNNLWNVQFTCLDKKKASLFLCFSLCFFSSEESTNRVLWRSKLAIFIYHIHILPFGRWDLKNQGFIWCGDSLRPFLHDSPLSKEWGSLGVGVNDGERGACWCFRHFCLYRRISARPAMRNLWRCENSGTLPIQTLPWPGERWHPWLISSEMRIWVERFCPLWSYLVWHRCRCPGEGACRDIWTDEPQDE